MGVAGAQGVEQQVRRRHDGHAHARAELGLQLVRRDQHLGQDGAHPDQGDHRSAAAVAQPVAAAEDGGPPAGPVGRGRRDGAEPLVDGPGRQAQQARRTVGPAEPAERGQQAPGQILGKRRLVAGHLARAGRAGCGQRGREAGEAPVGAGVGDRQHRPAVRGAGRRPGRDDPAGGEFVGHADRQQRQALPVPRHGEVAQYPGERARRERSGDVAPPARRDRRWLGRVGRRQTGIGRLSGTITAVWAVWAVWIGRTVRVGRAVWPMAGGGPGRGWGEPAGDDGVGVPGRDRDDGAGRPGREPGEAT
ncbi:hypothetical protein [Pseudofrankia saprophytica]|uniref:hypothetical protein n=1 Tax=Pseudofrankia saprophytica TaxID=298655 RepID=UPI000234D156|nr:hypothetical protein [Pseudofrankia saprophytica]